MTSHRKFFTVIMAGGSGTRLWPLSRREKPKQFLPFLSEKTLLQETFDRVATVVPPEHIYVSSGEYHVSLIHKDLPELPEGNILVEPSSRNTGNAILLVATLLEKKFPDSIIATIASDHAIGNPQEFTTLLKVAFLAAEQHRAIVTLGINPTRPDTALGYIKIGNQVGTYEKREVYDVEAFKEKPDEKTALEYLRSYKYLWNAGYFIFRSSVVLSLAHKYAPETMQKISEMVTKRDAETISIKEFSERYAALENVPFDTLIMEKLDQAERLVVPAPLEWSDIGTWNTLYGFVKNETGNDLVSYGPHLDLDSSATLVHSGKRLIATMNVKDLVIIDADDVLLVADRRTSGSAIKELLEKIKKERPELL